jgi:hypothetical protein
MAEAIVRAIVWAIVRVIVEIVCGLLSMDQAGYMKAAALQLTIE